MHAQSAFGGLGNLNLPPLVRKTVCDVVAAFAVAERAGDKLRG